MILELLIECKFRRVYFSKLLKDISTYGYFASKKEPYLGLKLLALVTKNRFITNFILNAFMFLLIPLILNVTYFYNKMLPYQIRINLLHILNVSFSLKSLYKLLFIILNLNWKFTQLPP